MAVSQKCEKKSLPTKNWPVIFSQSWAFKYLQPLIHKYMAIYILQVKTEMDFCDKHKNITFWKLPIYYNIDRYKKFLEGKAFEVDIHKTS